MTPAERFDRLEKLTADNARAIQDLTGTMELLTNNQIVLTTPLTTLTKQQHDIQSAQSVLTNNQVVLQQALIDLTRHVAQLTELMRRRFSSNGQE